MRINDKIDTLWIALLSKCDQSASSAPDQSMHFLCLEIEKRFIEIEKRFIEMERVISQVIVNARNEIETIRDNAKREIRKLSKVVDPQEEIALTALRLLEQVLGPRAAISRIDVDSIQAKKEDPEAELIKLGVKLGDIWEDKS